MKTLKIILFFIALGLGHSQAQVNLVPNPSFEILDSCPDWLFQLNKASHWFSSRNTPEYFHQCDISNNTGVPFNLFGHQDAHTGSGYIGLHGYSYQSTSSFREYASAKLDSTLVVGQRYFVTFYVSCTAGWNTAPIGITKFANNNLGALFSVDSFSQQSPLPILNFSHINFTSIITDTIDWVKIVGSFVSDSAYEYISIGNFFDDVNTSALLLFPNGTANLSYYFIDDVCVSTDSLLCNNIVGTDEKVEYNLKYYPNPVNDLLIIESPMKFISIKLYDNKLSLVPVPIIYDPLSIKLDFRLLSSGLYHVTLISKVEVYHLSIIKH